MVQRTSTTTTMQWWWLLRKKHDHTTSEQQVMISFPCYWNVHVFIFIFIHFSLLVYILLSCIINGLFLVCSMLVFCYRQHVSIALQHAQAIAILQWVVALGQVSSSLPHIIASAPTSLVNLWQTTALSS
jgi:presenilin-like A22 family membrane protease